MNMIYLYVVYIYIYYYMLHNTGKQHSVKKNIQIKYVML